MSRTSHIFALVALLSGVVCARCVDVYDFSMTLHVPRVYDNWQSTGYRKYRTQKITGTLRVESEGDGEPVLTFSRLTNKNHKVNGRNVEYEVFDIDSVAWHLVGSNRTGCFNTPSVCWWMMCEPDYNIGDDGEDNTLVVELAGRGSGRWLRGSVAGTLGCGCRAYGHVSPTRIFGSGAVVDTAAVYGTWKAKRRK